VSAHDRTGRFVATEPPLSADTRYDDASANTSRPRAVRNAKAGFAVESHGVIPDPQWDAQNAVHSKGSDRRLGAVFGQTWT
jgi:hypothetical protein